MIRKELYALTSVRFFAAFFVFLFHIEIRWALSGPQFLINIISQGAVAMSLFFILSGFILAYNYFDRDPINHYSDFFVKRIARIYPVYFFVTIFSLPWFGIHISDAISYYHAKFFLQTAFLFFSNLFLLQSWYPALFSYGVDAGTWSLSVEMFCYCLFPFILSSFVKASSKRLYQILIICYVLSISISLAYILFNPKPLFSTIYAIPIYRLPEFIIGMILGLFFVRLSIRGSNGRVSLKLLSVIFISFLYLGFYGRSLPVYISHNFIVIPCYALAIYYMAQLEKGWLLFLFSNKFIRLLGESSYSFFLLQLLSLRLGAYLVERYHTFNLHHWFLACTLIIINLLLALCSYKFLEKPCRHLVMRFFINGKFVNKKNVATISSFG